MKPDPEGKWLIYIGLVALILAILRLIFRKKSSSLPSEDYIMPEWLVRLRIWLVIVMAILVIIVGLIKSR